MGDRSCPACCCRTAVPCDGDEPRGRHVGSLGPTHPAPRGGPTLHPPAATGTRRRAPASRRADGLHQRSRPALAALPPRRSLRRRRPRANPGGRRGIGRLHPRVPDAVRARRPSRSSRTRLPLLPQRVDRPGHGSGADRRGTRHPLGADARSSRRGRAPRRADPRVTIEPDRHRARRRRTRRDHVGVPLARHRRDRRTRSTTASSTVPRRLGCSTIIPMRSWSTASRSTGR